MLRVVSDREVAKEAARVNVSALVAGQPRIVPRESLFASDRLGEALARGGEDLDLVRRAVSRVVERVTQRVPGLRPARSRDVGPER
jgi:hypothetical protein